MGLCIHTYSALIIAYTILLYYQPDMKAEVKIKMQ